MIFLAKAIPQQNFMLKFIKNDVSFKLGYGHTERNGEEEKF